MQVVERAERARRRAERAVELGARRDDDRRAAVVDLDPLDEPVGDERVDVRAQLLHPASEAAVLGDAPTR